MTIESWVWDVPPKSSRNAIHVAVSHLRDLLGSEAIGSDGGYALDPACATVDWALASAQTATARACAADGRYDDAERAARKAVGLFDGTPLDGLDSKAAASARADALRLKADAATVLALAWHANIQSPGATEIVVAAAGDAPLYEPVQFEAMRLLAAQGRVTEALQIYDAHMRRLAADTGASPSAQLQHAHSVLLSRKTAPPPVRRVARPAWSSAPRPAAPLLGRHRELDAVRQSLLSGYRIVTLGGPGGIGKSRLALELATWATTDQRWPVLFVDVGSAGSADAALDEALLPTGRPGLQSLAAGRSLVMLVDGAEHDEAGTASLVAAAVATDAHLRVLSTSRVRLRLRDERWIPLGGLEFARDDDAAVQLLVARGGALADERTDPAMLRRLAMLAQGVPLVLELLGSAFDEYEPQWLINNFEKWSAVAVGQEIDRPANQQSINATVSWSIGRLTADQQQALRALTLVAGSLPEAAACDIIAGSIRTNDAAGDVDTLAEAQLVQRTGIGADSRIRVFDPVRGVRWTSSTRKVSAAAVRAAHARHFLAAAGRADSEFSETETALSKIWTHDRAHVDAALTWALDNDRPLAYEFLPSVVFLRLYAGRQLQWAGDLATRMLLDADGLPAETARRLRIVQMTAWSYGFGPPDATRFTDAIEAMLGEEDRLDEEWTRRWLAVFAQDLGNNGRIDDGLAALDRYPRRSARDMRRWHLQRAMCRRGLGNKRDDITDLLLASDPSAADRAHEGYVQTNLVLALSLTGDLDGAERAWHRAEEISDPVDQPAHAALNINACWFASKSGRFDLVRSLITTLRDESSLDDAAFLLEVGAILYSTGTDLLTAGDRDRVASAAWALRPSFDRWLDGYVGSQLDEIPRPRTQTTADNATAILRDVVAKLPS